MNILNEPTHEHWKVDPLDHGKANWLKIGEAWMDDEGTLHNKFYASFSGGEFVTLPIDNGLYHDQVREDL